MSKERNAALRRYVDLKTEVSELEAEVSEKKAKRDEEMRNAFELLRADGTKKSTTVDLGPGYGEIRFTPRTTKRKDIYDEKAFKDWIDREQKADELYWANKIRDKAVNDLLKEMLEHETELPPGLGYVDQKGVTVTRLDKKA